MDNISRDTQYLQIKDFWSSLPLSKKAEMIKAAVKNGIYDLPTIRKKYNEFAEGGDTSYDDKLIDFVIQEEGFLKDPEDIGDGKQTLGSGLTAKKWHDLYRQRGNKWSEEDNRIAVAEELSNRRRWAEKNVPNWDTLPEDSKNAMLSYKYNYDFNAENSPNMYAALRNRDWEEAARQMDATSKDPKFKKGLADRRAREQMLFLEGFVNSPLGPVLPKAYADQQEIIEPVSIRPLLQTPKRIDPRLAPIMVPDKDRYVSIHRITQEDADREEEQRIVDKIKAMDRFNKMMDMLSVENTATPAFVPYNPYVVNSNADGGSIYIKPSHRGRLTELKKRTGKTEAELYNDGNPAHKKMVVFARNARRWKHGLGGNLFSGEEEGSQQMNTPTFWGGTLPEVEIVAPRKWFDSLGDYLDNVGSAISSAKDNAKNLYEYSKNYLRNKLKGYDDEEIIDLSNQNVSRITKDTPKVTSILTNDFLEDKNNVVRKKKDFVNTTDTLLGDNNIPLSNISTFYGIENGKLKAGPLEIFNDTTTVVPNRAKYVGKVKKIIPAKRASEEYNKAIEAEIREYNKAHGYTPTVAQYITDALFNFSAPTPRGTLGRRASTSERLQLLNDLHQKYAHLGDFKHRAVITENGDTIYSYNLNASPKVLFTDEQGNALFVANPKNHIEELNKYLAENPRYSVMVDNGRFASYQTTIPSIRAYAGIHNPDNMFILGTVKKEGGVLSNL